jgi:peptide/nickel transport system permease protein
VRRIVVNGLVGLIPVLFGVSIVTFILTSLVPGDAGRSILGMAATQEQVDALNAQLGLDKPLPVQYWEWLIHALRGDLGESITSGVPVTQQIASVIGVTLWLILGSLLLAAVLGVSFGVISAVRGGWMGRAVDVIAMAGMAVPNFWLALVLVTLLAVSIPIFPAIGYTPISSDPVKWFQGLVLPVVTLGISSAAPVAKQTRDGVLSQLNLDYVRVLRARGIPERTIIFKHVLRNAAAPIFAVLGIVVVSLFGGTVLIETVFVIPGLGSLAVRATSTQDIPIVLGVAMTFTVIVVLVNLAIEVIYAILNPKVRT